MSRRIRWLVIALVHAPIRVLLAQDTNTVVVAAAPAKVALDTTPRCGFCRRPSVPAALFEGILIGSLLNRVNAWVLNDSTARVSPTTWKHNFQQGWDWDTDDFVVNMLGHPYMGSTFFAAGRTNGLGFWASAPMTVFHAAGWEYFGETTQPSVNDLVNTSMGGIALGEMFHRVAATIRDNEAGGAARVWREVAAIPFDPVGSVNRLVRGEWSRKGRNPIEHNPVGTVLRTGAGIGVVRAPGASGLSLAGADLTSILFADVKYGDSYVDTLRKPFDAFSMRILLAPRHGGLTQLFGVGRLVSKELGSGEGNRRQLELNQQFEYVNNDALQFGAQTIQLGLSTRVRLADRYWLRALIAADAIVLSGINAPGAGTGARNYDFGPGVGGTFTATIEHDVIPYLTVRFSPAYTHTVSGSSADHGTTLSSIEANIPVKGQLALVIHGSTFTRSSRYADGTTNNRAIAELRVFAAFKTAHRPPVAR